MSLNEDKASVFAAKDNRLNPHLTPSTDNCKVDQTIKPSKYEPRITISGVEYDFGLKFKVRQHLTNDSESDVLFIGKQKKNSFTALFDEKDTDYEIIVENLSPFTVKFEVKVGDDSEGNCFIVRRGVKASMKTVKPNGNHLHFKKSSKRRSSSKKKMESVNNENRIDNTSSITFKLWIELTDQEITDKNQRLMKYDCLLRGRPDSLPMDISVLMPNGKVSGLAVAPKDTIELIKYMIQRSEAIPLENQILIFGNKPLDNRRTLRHYEIPKQSNLHLIVQPITGESGALELIDEAKDRALVLQQFGYYNKKFVESDTHLVKGFTLKLKNKSIDKSFKVLEQIYHQF